jgi:hypothetical protein
MQIIEVNDTVWNALLVAILLKVDLKISIFIQAPTCPGTTKGIQLTTYISMLRHESLLKSCSCRHIGGGSQISDATIYRKLTNITFTLLPPNDCFSSVTHSSHNRTVLTEDALRSRWSSYFTHQMPRSLARKLGNFDSPQMYSTSEDRVKIGHKKTESCSFCVIHKLYKIKTINKLKYFFYNCEVNTLNVT